MSDRAISAGVRLPIGSPIGPCSRFTSPSLSPSESNRDLRFSLLTREPNVEGIGLQRGEQRHVVQTRVVGQRHDGGVGIRLDGQHGIVRHARHETDGGVAPVVAVAFTGVADQHLEAEAACQFGGIARQLPGADHQQAPGRTEGRTQGRAIEVQHLVAPGWQESHHAAGQIQAAQQAFMIGAALQQFVQPTHVGQRLFEQAQGTATRQAEPRGFLLADAISDQLARGTAIGHRLSARQQVILDAAS